MRISVALCSYNGARFLAEQLDSIASQTRLPDELVVCDDGSSDDTIPLLEQFASKAKFPVSIVKNATNLGAIANFRQAISLCSGELTALADQDDVWLPEKLERAEQAFLNCKNGQEVLYCTRLQYVDSRLQRLGVSRIPGNTGFSNAVVENSATGCSVVFGDGIKQKFLKANPADMAMHDWWLYMLATAFGEVIYDDRISVLYRQHDSNVAGWRPRPNKLWHRWKSLRQRLKTDRNGMDSLNQAIRFINAYQDVPAGKKNIVDELVQLRTSGIGSRFAYALRSKVMRNDAYENFGLKIMILMRWH